MALYFLQLFGGQGKNREWKQETINEKQGNKINIYTGSNYIFVEKNAL